MALADRIRTADPTRFLGRRASNCRKCGASAHYVNRVGGIVCRVCQPPASEQDCQIELECVNGEWALPWDGQSGQDEPVGGDHVPVASGDPEESHSSSPTLSSGERLARSKAFWSWLSLWSSHSDDHGPGGLQTISRATVTPLACYWPRRSEKENPLIVCRCHQEQLFWKSVYATHQNAKDGGVVWFLVIDEDGKRRTEKRTLKPGERLREEWTCGICHPPVDLGIVVEWMGNHGKH